MICHSSEGNCKQQQAHKMFCVPALCCPCIPPLPLCLDAEEQGTATAPALGALGFQGRMNGLTKQQKYRSMTTPAPRRLMQTNLQLLSLATEDTSSPTWLRGERVLVCGLSFLGGNSAGQTITHTPVLTADIPVLTPRAALSYFRGSHFHIPPSNSPPRSDQSLSAFTLQ